MAIAFYHRRRVRKETPVAFIKTKPMPLFVRNLLIALGITAVLAFTVWYAISYLDHKRIAELGTLETELSTNTLSLETQFSLLENAPCEQADGDGLSAELSDLGDRLSFLEVQLGSDHTQVVQLKKQYMLLEIRDYLLSQKLAKVCKLHPATVLYFYSNTKEGCPTCDRAGYALSYLRNTYPTLRVYSFDYSFDLGALQTLIKVDKVKDTLPAFIINGKTSYGFESADALRALLPKSVLESASTTATSTKK